MSVLSNFELISSGYQQQYDQKQPMNLQSTSGQDEFYEDLKRINNAMPNSGDANNSTATDSILEGSKVETEVTSGTITCTFCFALFVLGVAIYLIRVIYLISKKEQALVEQQNNANSRKSSNYQGARNHNRGAQGGARSGYMSQYQLEQEQGSPSFFSTVKQLSQGRSYKIIFLGLLLLTDISRTLVLSYTGISLINMDYITVVKSTNTSMILSNIPSLFYMASFSVFIYYIGQLTLQLESHKLMFFEDDSARSIDQRRLMLLHNRDAADGGPTSNKYDKPNMLKPFFIVFNCFINLTYFTTCFVFMSNKDDPEYDLTRYYRIVCGINGVSFIILTLALLNYGSRLEKIISQIKMKGLWAEATMNKYNNQNNNQQQVNNNNNNVNHSADQESQQARIYHNRNISGQEQQKSTALQDKLNLLAGLNMRISVLTISMAILLMLISVTELLCTWEIINPVRKNLLLLIFGLFLETIPTLALGIIMKPSEKDVEQETYNPNTGYKPLNADGYHPSNTSMSMSQKGVENPHNLQINPDDANSSEDDSEYGNFNPNLFTGSQKKPSNSQASSHLGNSSMGGMPIIPPYQQQQKTQHDASILIKQENVTNQDSYDSSDRMSHASNDMEFQQ